MLHPVRVAMTVDGKRKIGQPKMTWLKTFNQDLRRVNISR